MQLKLSPQGYLVYATMALYAAAALAGLAARLARRGPGGSRTSRRLGVVFWAAYGLGFAVAASGWVYRWVHTGHVPLQNLFESFLTMGMLVPVMTVIASRGLGVGLTGLDPLLAAAVLFPAGFVEKFSEAPQHLPPSLQSPLFAPHVLVYMAGYVILAKAALFAIARLAGRRGAGPVDNEESTYRMVCMGFPLLTAGLVLGAWWAKIVWGDYWRWDAKELWSLASWLAYVAYFHVRHQWGRRRPRLNAALVVIGLLLIVGTLFVVNLMEAFASSIHSYAT